jgi:hypothetical protein
MKSLAWAGDWPVSQWFNDPCCRAAYTRFGIVGHNGIDLATNRGTPLLAPEKSYVLEVSSDPLGYGLTVYLLGASGHGYRYGHADNLFVRQGETVDRLTLVAYSGNTGNSTGPHLHFGTKPPSPNLQNGFNGYVDPVPVLAWLEQQYAQEQDDEMALTQDERDALELIRALSWNKGSIEGAIGKLGRAAEIGRTIRSTKRVPKVLKPVVDELTVIAN